MPIKLQRYCLALDVLAATPPAERDLFLAFGAVANELILLQKLVLWTPSKARPEPFLQSQITQSMILIRVLGGKLHEAWMLVQRDFFGSKVSSAYDGSLEPEAQAALGFLKKYHSSANILNEVRNEYAFHFSARQFGAGFAHGVDESLPIYLALQPANNLFYCSELLGNVSLIGERPTMETMARFNALVEEVTILAHEWLKFVGGYISLFLARYRSVIEDQPEIIELADVPSLDAVAIPWFIAEVPS